MRKLSWACESASLHHALASCAITEGGQSKRHVNETGYTRSVNITDEQVKRGEGQYVLKLDEEEPVVRVRTLAGGCATRWRFTYPDWKLLTMHLETCACRDSAL